MRDKIYLMKYMLITVAHFKKKKKVSTTTFIGIVADLYLTRGIQFHYAEAYSCWETYVG